jgi:hypothetical protein
MVAEADLMENTNMNQKNRGGGASGGASESLIGRIVERIIEDTWFIGKIIDHNHRAEECTIQYLDDDLIESNIPMDEIRFSSKLIDLKEIRTEKKQTLSKPLIGLVEDDSDLRSVHQPVAILHSDAGGSSSRLCL